MKLPCTLAVFIWITVDNRLTSVIALILVNCACTIEDGKKWEISQTKQNKT